MKRLLLPVVAAAALATGCYHHGDVGVGYTYGYATAGPDLYYMSPGVSVVAYSEYPTFYADNYYWMYNGGVWYRSPYYGSGWVVAYDVPYRIRSIRQPHTYARFTPGRGWHRTRPTYTRPTHTRPGYQQPGTVRDHRSTRGGYYPTRSYNPARTHNPAVRDHRRAPARSYSPPVRYNAPARTHRAPSASPRHVPRGSSVGRPAVRDHRRR